MATGNIPDQLKGHVGHAYFKHPVFSENQIKWLALTKIWHLIFLFLILYVNLKWSIPLPSLRFDVEKEKVRKIYDFRFAVHVIFSTPVTHVFTRQDEGWKIPLSLKHCQRSYTNTNSQDVISFAEFYPGDLYYETWMSQASMSLFKPNKL